MIQDSTSPIPKKRNTRAAAAAAAAASEKWNAANGAVNGSAAKKRKAEEDEAAAAAAKKAKQKAAVSAREFEPALAYTQVPAPAAPQQTQASSSTSAHPAWDDAEGHYIVKPDDVIGGRCKLSGVRGD